ncbi:N-acetyltransferase [Demequina sp. NBRC 110051]|uniref:GNAT family N-acetyltransferase n=1 Tax=Demequina sp. NBRC 110051 TaxID=1570340 RepID=UPI000A0169EB|nr:N-acetyltransferase [Demequina sp. NBRC 110051]
MTVTHTVRPATASDIPALVDLAAVTFPLACPPTTTREAMDAHIAAKLNADVIGGWISSPTHAVVVADAVVAGTLDGYALATFGPCSDPEAAVALSDAGVATDPIHELSKIYVRAEAHGGGLAGALMEAAVAATREGHGPGPVWLGTNDANLRAQAFYRRHGFTLVGARTFDVGGNRETDVVMLRLS